MKYWEETDSFEKAGSDQRTNRRGEEDRWMRRDDKDHSTGRPYSRLTQHRQHVSDS
jgi:hypothetical protein